MPLAWGLTACLAVNHHTHLQKAMWNCRAGTQKGTKHRSTSLSVQLAARAARGTEQRPEKMGFNQKGGTLGLPVPGPYCFLHLPCSDEPAGSGVRTRSHRFTGVSNTRMSAPHVLGSPGSSAIRRHAAFCSCLSPPWRIQPSPSPSQSVTATFPAQIHPSAWKQAV